MKVNVIEINPLDNVVVATIDIVRGDLVSLPGGVTFPALSDIPCGHKIVRKDIEDGQSIIKYGEPIGQARGPLKKGDWVHIHNMIIEGEK